MTNFSDFLDLESFKNGSKTFEQIWNEMLLAVEAFAEGSDRAIMSNVQTIKVVVSEAEKLLTQLKKVSNADAIEKITKKSADLASQMNKLDAENKALMKSNEKLLNTLVDAQKEYDDLNKSQKQNAEQTEKQVKQVETYAGKIASLALKLNQAKKEANQYAKAQDDIGFAKASKEVEKYAEELQSLKQAEKELQKAQKDRAKEQSKQAKQAEKELLSQVNSVEGLRAKLSLLTAKRNKVEIGSEGFDELQKEILQTTNQLKDLEEASGDFRRNVGNYKESVIGAIQATGGFGSSIVDLGTGLAESFGTGGYLAVAGFAVTQLVSLFGKASEAVAELNGQVSQVGKTFAGTGEDAQSVTSSLLALTNVAKFAETDFENLTKAVNNAVRNFGESADKITQDITIAFSRLPFQSQRDEFLEGINEYGENLSKLGLSFSEVSAVAVKAVEQGAKDVDTVFDLLNNAQIELQRLDISKDLKEFFGANELKELEQLQKDNNFEELLSRISQKIIAFGEDSKLAGDLATKAFTSLGEERGAKGTINVLANLDEVVKEYNNSLTDAERRTLKLVEVNKEVAESQIELAQKFKGTGQTFELLGAQIKAGFFDFLLDAFDFFAERFDNLKMQFQDAFAGLDNALSDSELETLINGLQKAGQEIVKTLGIILDFAGQIAGNAFKNLITQFVLLKDLISGVLDFLGVDFVDIIDRSIDSITGLFASIGEIFDNLGRNIKNFRDAFEVVVSFFPKFADAIAKNPITVEITKEIQEFEKFVTDTFNDIVSFFADIFDSLGISETFKAEFSEVIEVFNIFGSETDKAGSKFTEFTDILARLFKGGIGTGIIRTVALIGDAVSTLFEQILNRTGDFANALELLLSGDLTGAKELFTATIEDIQKSTPDAIFASFEESLKTVTGEVDEQTNALQTNNEAQKETTKSVETNTTSLGANTTATNTNAEAQKKLADARKEANEFIKQQNKELAETEIALLQAQGKEKEALLQEQNQKELELQEAFNADIAKIDELKKSGGLTDKQVQEERNKATKEFLNNQELLTIESNKRLEEIENERIEKDKATKEKQLEDSKEVINKRVESEKTGNDKELALRKEQYLEDIQNKELSEKEKKALTEQYENDVQELQDNSVELEIERLKDLNELDALSKEERLQNEVAILDLQNQLSEQALQRQKERDAERLESTKATLSEIGNLSKELFGQLADLQNSKADAEINSLNREQEIRQSNLDAQIQLAEATSTSEIDFASENERLVQIEQRKLKIEKKRASTLLLISLLEKGTDALTASDKIAEILSGVDSTANIQSRKEGGFINFLMANPVQFNGGRTYGNKDKAIPAWLHGGEYVVKNEQVQKHPELVEQLENERLGGSFELPDTYKDYGDIQLMQKQNENINQVFVKQNPAQQIDYSRLGSEVYSAMSRSLKENQNVSMPVYNANGKQIGEMYVRGNTETLHEFKKPIETNNEVIRELKNQRK